MESGRPELKKRLKDQQRHKDYRKGGKKKKKENKWSKLCAESKGGPGKKIEQGFGSNRPCMLLQSLDFILKATVTERF